MSNSEITESNNKVMDIWGADYANGVIPFFHKDENGNIISKKISGGTYTVKNSVIILEEYPDLQYGLTIKLLSGGTEEPLTRVETNYSNLGEHEYKVDIVTGFVHFHPSLEGCQVKVEDYCGKGLWLITDKRIVAKLKKLPNGSIDYESLADVIENAKGFISKGTWSESIEYDKNNIVVHNGVLYRAKEENSNKNPESESNKEYWEVVIDVKSIIDVHAEIVATNTELGHVKLSDDADSTLTASLGVAATPKAVSDVRGEVDAHIANKNNPHGVNAEQVGALPITGGTLTGDLRLEGSTNWGRKISFGDSDYVYLKELNDDVLEIYGDKGINLRTDVGGDDEFKITANGKELFSGNYNDLTHKPESMTPTSHASTSTTYGAGNSSNYGHLKLSDSTTSTSNENGGTAATPYAVKLAYDLASKKANKEASSGGFVGGLNATEIYGGGAIGMGATVTGGGGAVGLSTETEAGGAIGNDAHTGNGGSVGNAARSTSGGSVGEEAKATEGFAGGKEANTYTGGAIGKKAVASTAGGAVGQEASTIGGGSVGASASSKNGGAVGLCASSSKNGGAVGFYASSQGGGAVGGSATTQDGGAVGVCATSQDGGAVGAFAAAGEGFAGGLRAKTGVLELHDDGENVFTPIDAIQLGTGINSKPETLQVYNRTLLNSDGTIPIERLNINGAASSITKQNLFTNRALVSDSSGKVTACAVSTEELLKLQGVTDNIQTQLNQLSGKSTVNDVDFKIITDIYSVDISKRGSDNNILYITIPNIESYSDIDGKMIHVYTGIYSNDKTQTVWLNINGYGSKPIRKIVPDGSYESSTYKAYEINRHTVMQLYISGDSVFWVNPTNSLTKNEKQVATFVIGSSAAGYTASNVDYLCDGTSDQVEINAAISALPSNGGKIVLLEGTYNISASININKANVAFEGMGNGTVLKRMFNDSGEFNSGVIKINGSGSNCNLRGFAIDGNKAVYTDLNNKGILVIDETASDNIIENLRIYNENTGVIVCGGSSKNIIQKNVIKNVAKHGLYIYYSSNNIVSGNIFSYIGDIGIVLYWNSSCNNITSNYLHNCESSGISVFSSVKYTLITGNFVTSDNNDDVTYYSDNSIETFGNRTLTISNIYPSGSYYDDGSNNIDIYNIML